MKLFLLCFLNVTSFSAIAANYDNILCQSAAGFTQAYFGDHPVPMRGGCYPAVECAATGLSTKISQIPEANTAGYSKTLSEYVEVSKKSVSKVTLSSNVLRTVAYHCGERHNDSQVDCTQATACASVSVEYTKCTKVSYDSETGNKIVTCPSGRVIR